MIKFKKYFRGQIRYGVSQQKSKLLLVSHYDHYDFDSKICLNSQSNINS
jgi:hypothetical protein